MEGFTQEVITLIRSGEVAVIPTDTVYGMVASALNPVAVERVYTLKRRDPRKACIVLIADIDDTAQLTVEFPAALKSAVGRFWPGPYSILFPNMQPAYRYLHRGTEEVAFRLPDDEALRAFLRLTGPLIAPSANPEGLPPATSVAMAIDYFGDQIPVYVDLGKRDGKLSTLLRLSSTGHPDILRA